MQNNKLNKIKQIVKAKGYYIVLFACLIAVGTSGYLYYRNRDTRKAKQQTETAASNLKEKTVLPAAITEYEPSSTEIAEDVISMDTMKKGTEIMAKPDAAMPLEGNAIAEFAADHLAYNETTKDWRTHFGIDIAAEAGEDVRAAADGLVTAVYDDAELGKTVVIEHKGSYQTQYSNLTPDTLVNVGDRVTKGTVLGAVGDTAMSEVAQEPHLHFAVYHGSKPVDPKDFFNP
ncbi:MAG: M23 family metallopeptidase [Clostridia bacterium]|nr:M23 family metallopeptidase [Clostridia bacterium]